MEISEYPDAVSVPEFTLEYGANFNALRSKNFEKLLIDVQAAAASIPTSDKVLHASAQCGDNLPDKTFTIILTVRTSSWFSGGELLNELVTKILTDAEIVQYGAYDTAFERFRKSQSERFVIPAGHSTRTIQEAS